MGAPIYIFTLQQCCLGMWEMEDHHFKALGVAVTAEIAHSDMLRRGKGIQARDHKLADMSSNIETDYKTGEDSSIEGIIKLQILLEFGNELQRCKANVSSSWRTRE